MKYKQRLALIIVGTGIFLFTSVILNFKSYVSRTISVDCPKLFMTADWTVDSIYEDLNFTLNKKDGLYTVKEKHILKYTIQKDKESEPLKIIVVPHSHNDPGWLWTFEDYYTIRTQSILTNTIIALKRFPDFRMIWSETVFLERWWRDATEEMKSDFRNLVRYGKIEILSGGWVSVDEATTQYNAVVDQLIEGHLWLKEHIGVTPNISWSIDPFGYSATLPYLWKRAGMENMAILRIHGAVKGYMGNRKMLTYHWRQAWDMSGDNDIYCHVEPYTLYNIECSCGPDTEVCKALDFSNGLEFPANNEPIYFGAEGSNRMAKNFEEFAALVVEQYKKKASLYKHNTILMPHGDDFRYITENDFDVNYKNMQRLMNYINFRTDWNVQIKFGTVGEYFESLNTEKLKDGKTKDVSLTGDFFTYTDKDNEYWSGYFTTRPFDKRMIRELFEYLRTTETMTSLIYVYLLQNTNIKESEWIDDWKAIQSARRTHGLVQHHDAITGTSTAVTVMDFELRVNGAINLLLDVLQKRISNVLMPGSNSNMPDFKMTRELLSPTENFGEKIIPITETSAIVFINSYFQMRREIVRIHVSSYDIEVYDNNDNLVKFQASPIWTKTDGISAHGYEIFFEITIEGLGLSVYTIKQKSKLSKHKNKKVIKPSIAKITSYKGRSDSQHELFTPRPDIDKTNKEDVFSIENQHLKLSFSKTNGALQTVCKKAEYPFCLKLKIDFIKYLGNNSNAYCFNTNGKGQSLMSDITTVSLTQGSHMSQVKVHHRLFSHTVTLYQSDGLQGKTVHIENIATLLSPDDHDTELMMRISTEINNVDTRYFTDSNGFQMMSRKFRENLPIGANFYPMTTMSVLEDNKKRLTLHTSQPLGISSLSKGSLEVMLDRVPMSNGKGLDEPVTDNKPAISKFVLQMESVNGHNIDIDYRKYRIDPSLNSHLANDLLQTPIVSLFSSTALKILHKELTFYEPHSLPCSMAIANFRSLLNEKAEFLGTGVTLHKRLLSCSVLDPGNDCEDDRTFYLNSIFKNVEVSDVREMSLSHVSERKHGIDNRMVNMKPMELSSYQIKWKT